MKIFYYLFVMDQMFMLPPWTEESGRLQSMGSQESDTTYWLNHHHQNSCLTVLIPNGVVFGDGNFGGQLGFRWGHEGGVPMIHGISVLIRRRRDISILSPSCKDMVKMLLSKSQEENSHQKPNLSAPTSIHL